MKRWSDEHAAAVARTFARSDLAQAWEMLGAPLWSCVIDSLVMNELRVADSVDSSITLTACEIITFRSRVGDALADGVKRRAPASLRGGAMKNNTAGLLTWNDVLDAARCGAELWYARTAARDSWGLVQVIRIYKNGKLKLYVHGRAGAFVANAADHLINFRRGDKP